MYVRTYIHTYIQTSCMYVRTYLPLSLSPVPLKKFVTVGGAKATRK